MIFAGTKPQRERSIQLEGIPCPNVLLDACNDAVTLCHKSYLRSQYGARCAQVTWSVACAPFSWCPRCRSRSNFFKDPYRMVHRSWLFLTGCAGIAFWFSLCCLKGDRSQNHAQAEPARTAGVPFACLIWIRTRHDWFSKLPLNLGKVGSPLSSETPAAPRNQGVPPWLE